MDDADSPGKSKRLHLCEVSAGGDFNQRRQSFWKYQRASHRSENPAAAATDMDTTTFDTATEAGPKNSPHGQDNALRLEVWKWFWKGCKPNSVCTLASGENHLSGQPIPGIRPLSRNWSGPLRDSLFGLAPDGVFRAVPLTRDAVVSYTTFSPLPVALAKHRRFNFLWHCPSESLSTFRPRVSQSNGLELRGIAPFGVRTFLFQLAPKAILRPSKTT